MPKKTAPVPENTKYLDRLIEALTLLCGGTEPPREMVHEWERGSGEELQDWAANNTKIRWAQGIGTIEAAQVMADTPEEGQGHELRRDAYPSQYGEQDDPPNTVAKDLADRITEVFGDDWNLRMIAGGSGDLTVPGGQAYFNCGQGLDDLLANPSENDSDAAVPANTAV
jgi:hypothetical protein